MIIRTALWFCFTSTKKNIYIGSNIALVILCKVLSINYFWSEIDIICGRIISLGADK
jgi:hypothetical protein